jgi:hypothetical protein
MRKFLVSSGKAVESAIEGISVSRVPRAYWGHFGLIYRGNEDRRVRILVGGRAEPLFQRGGAGME